MPATAHGTPDAKPCWFAGPSAPAAVPQRWQNFAPGVSGAPQAAQSADTSVAPQFEQNLPDALALHPGQVTTSAALSDDEDDNIAPKATRRPRRALLWSATCKYVTGSTKTGWVSDAGAKTMTYRLSGTTHFLTIDVADWTSDPEVAAAVARRSYTPVQGRPGEMVRGLLAELEAANTRATFFITGAVAHRD